MKLASYVVDGKDSFGAVTDKGVVDLGRRLAGVASLREVLVAGRLGEAAKIAAKTEADFALASVALRRPIVWPEKIFCVGVNYAERNEEYKDGSDRPKYPSLFMRGPDSLVAHDEALIRPPESRQLDYEGEIAVVIGKAGRRIPEAMAAEHIAGLTCMNEGTIRDWLRHGKFNVTQGKNFDRTGAIGPWMTTLDDCPALDALRVTTRVNGEVRQDDVTSRMMFPIPRLIAYISTFATLKPGDVIATGTPTGAGARFDPPRYLVPGDTVEVEVSGVGILSNRVADET